MEKPTANTNKYANSGSNQRGLFLPKSGAGFTLIELLVVIAIIGLLASVVLIALNNTRSKSRDAKRVADMNQLAKGLEMYFNSCNSYPTLSASTTLSNTLSLYTGSSANCGNNQGAATNGGLGSNSSGATIVGKMPSAPMPADSAACTSLNNYVYRSYDDVNLTTASNTSDTTAGGYLISFCLGDKTGSLQAGPRIITSSGFR